MMQQTLGQFKAPLHAAGKGLGFFFGAIGETNAASISATRALQRCAAQSVDMADERQVLFGGQLDVDALRLEDHADIARAPRRVPGRHRVP